MHDYGDVCQSITELAAAQGTTIGTEEFRVLNQCLDDAIAGAVTEYGAGRTQSGIDGESARGTERLGFLAHELRNLVNTAILAFDVLQTGDVGVGGSTGTVLHRSLKALSELITRSLAEVRPTQPAQNRQQFLLAGFISELTPAAALEANARGIRLDVTPVEDGIIVDADREVMLAVVANLLQNAFKFTRPGTTVTLRVGGSAERALIEIQDECGGLAGGDATEVFRPFEQRNVDRTGLGLGLAFSRWAVEANRGRIYARNLPDRGCVFTIDLPRFETSESPITTH
ncbi:MAG: HAMP domain-containing sensor histidine kinase [Acidobacteriota bacterium]